LESLVAIGEEQSFIEAARRVGYSQSTISMQVKALEEELGVELVDRSVRPIVLTPAGVAVTESAREIVGHVGDIKRSAQAETELAGSLRLGVVQTATHALLPSCMSTIVKTHPGIKIAVQSGLSAALAQQLRGRKFDAIVATEPKAIPEELSSQVVLRERLTLVSGADLRVKELNDLTRHPFIRFNRRVGVGAIVDDFLARSGVVPAEFMELDSIEAILAMVERGLGSAIVPERSIGPQQRERLRVTPIDDEQATRNVSLLSRIDCVKSQLLSVVLDALRAAARQT